MKVLLPAAPWASSRTFESLCKASNETKLDFVWQHALALQTISTESVEALASLLDVPAAELLASPFGLRMAALGAEVGAAFVHQELRDVSLSEDAFVPDEVRDSEHGEWGALGFHVGKYQAFTLEDSLCGFSPNYGAKWTPHELLHRAVGYAHDESFSRFDLYLAARLAEVLPVTTFFGLEHLLRGDERGSFNRKSEDRIDRARARPFWKDASEADLKRRLAEQEGTALGFFAHLQAELEAIDGEIDSRKCITVDSALINGSKTNTSSDATAYVVGHQERLQDAAYSKALAQVGEVLGNRSASIADFRKKISRVLERLLFEEIEIDFDRIKQKRDQRMLADLFLRASLVASSNTKAQENLSRDFGAFIDRLRSDRESHFSVAPNGLANAFASSISRILGPKQTAPVLQNGARFLKQRGAHARFADGSILPGSEISHVGLVEGESSFVCLAQAERGLATFFPQTLLWLPDALRSSLLELFANDLTFAVRLPFGERFLRFLQNLPGELVPPSILELARFENDLFTRHLRDDSIERLSVSADEIEERGTSSFAAFRVCASSAFQVFESPVDVAEMHVAEEDEASWDLATEMETRASRYLLGNYRGDVSVLPWPHSLGSIFDRLSSERITLAAFLAEVNESLEAQDMSSNEVEEGWPEDAEGWLLELLRAGAIGLC